MRFRTGDVGQRGVGSRPGHGAGLCEHGPKEQLVHCHFHEQAEALNPKPLNQDLAPTPYLLSKP